jgi:hypothetical protein
MAYRWRSETSLGYPIPLIPPNTPTSPRYTALRDPLSLGQKRDKVTALWRTKSESATMPVHGRGTQTRAGDCGRNPGGPAPEDDRRPL